MKTYFMTCTNSNGNISFMIEEYPEDMSQKEIFLVMFQRCIDERQAEAVTGFNRVD